MSTYQPRHVVADAATAPQRRLLVRGGLAAAAMVGIGVVAPTSAFAALPTLRRGSRGTAVKTLQSRLRALGYSVGAVDGIFGSQTDSAVRAFQRRKRLVADGIVGAKTWAALGTTSTSTSGTGSTSGGSSTAGSTSSTTSGTTPTLKTGSSGSAVIRLQKALRANGYWLSGVDGKYGQTTQQAVMAVQKYHGLTRDGICGPATWRAVKALSRPRARTTSGTIIEVDLRRQLLFFVVSGKVRWVFNTSTGTSRTPTPRGRWRIERQINGMRYAPLGNLWRPKYWWRGYAIHGSTSIPGYPASHGCARVSNSGMNYIWSAGLAPIGRRIWVY